MNIDNGHLIRFEEEFFQDLPKIRSSFLAVPPELEAEAVCELAGRNETYVDLKAATPLASWAAKKRAERDKKKDKRQMIKKSKRRNRA
ncbi:hypothetical protein [Sporomusa sp. KB1]|jgi:hypothetical protein|uniref:hypothetical protein n=1 Tax=Sporomusa sp. KB1 TaxID=943346 RepID=UPI00119D8262|nr:hypothetical protein [Sporomusa sp. KB1]TWH48535.1 hypothetical protein Salpa_4699 [Sporomusa sp. KB1]